MALVPDAVLMYTTHPRQGASSERVVTWLVDGMQTSSPFQRSLPKVLRTSFLLVFSAVVIVLCLLTGLLWQLSQRTEGIQIGGVNHYVLTYGPTAVLIWLVAFWRQVDFHVKDSTPWNELHKGTASASGSVLLDYVSVLQIAAFWTAVRNRHLPIVATTLGFALLKVATLSSTGFLFIQTYQLNGNITTTLDSHFLAPIVSNASNTALLDKSLFYTTYGILAQNLSKPFGLSEGLAYATFTSDPGSRQAVNMTGKLDGFVPSFQCIAVDLTATLPAANSTDPVPQTVLQIGDSACSLRRQAVALHTLNPRVRRCPTRQLSGLMTSIDCPASVFNADGGAYKLFAMADFRYSQDLDQDDYNAKLSAAVTANHWNTEIARMSGIVCRLSYSMQKVTVNVATSSPQDITTITSQNTTLNLDNFSDDDFDLLFRASISASDQMLGDTINEAYALEYPDPMLKTMAVVSGSGYEGLLDNNTMAYAASKVSVQLGAQIAHQYLRSNESSPLILQASDAASRLSVTTISACVLLVSLGLVAGISLYLVLLLRGHVVGLKKSALVRTMSLAYDKSGIAIDLVNSQVCTGKQLNEKLCNVNVHLVQSPDGRTGLLLNDAPVFPTKDEREIPWWNPFTVSKVTLTVVFVWTLTTIVVLEILQRLSRKYHGFAILPQDTTKQTIFTHYIPALYFLLLASMYTCLDFNVLLLGPFQKMSKSAKIDELHEGSQLGRIPIFAWFLSLRNKSWGAVSSSSATLVGSLLAIVVSGLYEVDTLYAAQPLSVIASDALIPNWLNSGLQDGGASLISSLTENLHFPYPPGTFDEIAFPSLQVQDHVDQFMNSSIVLSMPAWRAHLECEGLSQAFFGIKNDNSPFGNSITINASYALPSNCMRGGSNGSESVLQFVQNFRFPTGQNSTYLGKVLDLHVGPYDPILGDAQGETMPSEMDDNPLGCPSLAFMYGFVDLETSASAGNGLADMVTIEVCYQQMQSVETVTTFLNPDFDIDITQPPAVNETSVKYLTVNDNITSYAKDPGMATAFSFRIQGHFDDTFVVFNNTNDNIFSGVSSSGDAVDSFFQGVLFGRSPVPFTSLKQETVNQGSQVKQSILSFYRRYMAQAISSNMRSTTEPLQSASSGSDFKAAYVANAPTALVTNRIVQNETSKLVLQGMLGFMLVCGIFTALTVQMHNLLPDSANPCTIWGQMSLWAGSSIYETPGGEVERRPSAKKGQYVVTEERITDDAGAVLFKLGWWSMRDGKKRYGIDVVRKDEI